MACLQKKRKENERESRGQGRRHEHLTSPQYNVPIDKEALYLIKTGNRRPAV